MLLDSVDPPVKQLMRDKLIDMYTDNRDEVLDKLVDEIISPQSQRVLDDFILKKDRRVKKVCA